MNYSREAEETVNGLLLIDNRLWEHCEQLTEDHFYTPEYKVLFSCIRQLFEKNKAVDVMTVAENINRDIIDIQQISDIAENCHGNLKNFSSYIDILIEKHAKRAIEQSLEDVRELGSSEAISTIESTLEKLSDDSSEADTVHELDPLIKDALERIDYRFNNGSLITGLETGFTELDEKTSGLQNGDMVVLAARPSMGKTAMAMNIVESALTNQKKQVVVFSVEMPAKGLMDRLLCSVGRIDATKWRNGSLNEDDWPKLTCAVNRLKDKPLIIDDKSNVSPSYMRNKLRQLKRKCEIGLVMVDYLQLMSIPNYKQGRVNEISEISRALKSIAKEFECPVIALSQLSRECEKRPDKRPINSDLRDSGAIEQDADIIMFLYRDEYYNPDSDQKGIGELIISKNRNGEVGTSRLAFEGRYTRFSNLAAEY